MRLLLDTHVLVRWALGSRDLSRTQRRALARASRQEPFLVSEISLWEIAMLVEAGRLRVQGPLRDWLEALVAPPRVLRLGISPAVAAEVANLPPALRRDPADRILVSTARVHRAALVTSDRAIIDAEVVPTIG